MSAFLIFDCYKTLIYKDGLEEAVQKFLHREYGSFVPIKFIKQAYTIIYNRYKFRHPRFGSAAQRRAYYVDYNRELVALLGYEISPQQAGILNKQLSAAPWACFSDTIPTLRYFKAKKQRMGLMANWTPSLDQVLTTLDLEKYFDFSVSSHKLGIEKPDPNFFSNNLKSILKQYDKVYYVGDDYELDVIPARQAGLIPVLLDRQGQYPLKVDCLKISSLNKLQQILKV